MSHAHKQLIDTVRVLNLNENVSTISVMDLINQNHINKDSFIVSDADQELLVLISFKHAIDLQSISIHSFNQSVNDEDTSAPKQVHIYKMDHLSVDFEDLSSLKADKSVTCQTKKLKKGQIICLQKSIKNAVKFTKTKHLAIYIDSNQKQTETTVLNAITIETCTETSSDQFQTECAIDLVNNQSSYSLPKCTSLKTSTGCDHVNNVLQCLCFYHSLDIQNNKSHQDDMVHHFTAKYKTLVDDYIHMIINHSHETDDIYNMAISMPNMKKCTLSNCVSAMHHHRDRANDIDIPLGKEGMFWREMLDACHCYVYHLYDFGLRIKVDDNSIHDDTDDDGYYKRYFDAHFAAICEKMKAIKANLNELNKFTFTRYENNKFALLDDIDDCDKTFMDGLYSYLLNSIDDTHVLQIKKTIDDDEEYDTYSIQMDMEDDLHSNMKELFHDNHYLGSIFDAITQYINDMELLDHSFQIGYLFYYWAHYSGDTYYIQSKFDSLKDEIQNNNICRLTSEQLNRAIQKAGRLVNTIQARKITAVRYNDADDPFHFNIKKGTSLSRNHVLSILLYTDYTELSKAFSSTFRPISPFETLSSTKRRNQQFAIWSRLLRETIAYFGNMSESGPFYCGLSRVFVVPEFRIELNGPTSTTKQLEVARRFSGECGITIQLTNTIFSSMRLPSFNCSWLSTFNGEDEHLWMGGAGRLRIESVRITETSLNYCRYFQSLYYFDCMLNTDGATKRLKPTHTDGLIMRELIQSQLNQSKCTEKHPKYIRQTFESYTKNKADINVSIPFIDMHFETLSTLLFHRFGRTITHPRGLIALKQTGQQTTNLLRPVIFQLFTNLKTIRIGTTHGDLYYVHSCTGRQYPLAYEMDLLSLLPWLNKTTLREVRINAELHLCSVSWLHWMWKENSTLLMKNYASHGWNIWLKTNETSKLSTGIRQDCLYIKRL